jgi:hypothetical protein
VPENPNDEVPAIARVVVQSMMLPGIMTFSEGMSNAGPNWVDQKKVPKK